MNAVYRRQRHIYDVTRRAFLFGRDRLIDGLAVPDDGHVLEVGCGTARNLVRIGATYPGSWLYGFDISSQMLETARGNIARAGLSGRVRLAEGDATDFDPAARFGTGGFERIVMSYCLSMIPDWQRALRLAARWLAAGGALHVVDFGDMAGWPRWIARAQEAVFARFHVSRCTTLAAALADAADHVGGRPTFQPLYGGYAWYGRIERP